MEAAAASKGKQKGPFISHLKTFFCSSSYFYLSNIAQINEYKQMCGATRSSFPAIFIHLGFTWCVLGFLWCCCALADCSLVVCVLERINEWKFSFSFCWLVMKLQRNNAADKLVFFFGKKLLLLLECNVMWGVMKWKMRKMYRNNEANEIHTLY